MPSRLKVGDFVSPQPQTKVLKMEDKEAPATSVDQKFGIDDEEEQKTV